MEAGWLEEARPLIEYTARSRRTAAEATGYRELIEHLTGRMSLDDCVEQIKIATRQLARRQMKWFRRFPRVHWIAGDRPVEEIVAGRPAIVGGRSAAVAFAACLTQHYRVNVRDAFWKWCGHTVWTPRSSGSRHTCIISPLICRSGSIMPPLFSIRRRDLLARLRQHAGQKYGYRCQLLLRGPIVQHQSAGSANPCGCSGAGRVDEPWRQDDRGRCVGGDFSAPARF